jgi:hypothetical protein
MKKEILDQIEIELNLAKEKRKGCWREDIEDKSFYDGKIEAFQEIRHFIKNEMSQS